MDGHVGEEIESLFERAHARNKRFQPSLLSVEKPFRVYNETDIKQQRA